MKTIKLLSLIIILLGSITSGSIWAATRSGSGHGGGSEHHAIGGQLAGGPHISVGQPYASGLKIARRGGGGRGGARGGGRGFGGYGGITIHPIITDGKTSNFTIRPCALPAHMGSTIELI